MMNFSKFALAAVSSSVDDTGSFRETNFRDSFITCYVVPKWTNIVKIESMWNDTVTCDVFSWWNKTKKFFVVEWVHAMIILYILILLKIKIKAACNLQETVQHFLHPKKIVIFLKLSQIFVVIGRQEVISGTISLFLSQKYTRYLG